MLDAAYALLAKVSIDADLTLEAPGGGRIRISSDADHTLQINSDDAHALWETFDLARTLGLVELDYRSLKQLRNPLLQDLEISVENREILSWPAGKLPRIRSVRGLISLLGHRRS